MGRMASLELVLRFAAIAPLAIIACVAIRDLRPALPVLWLRFSASGSLHI